MLFQCGRHLPNPRPQNNFSEEKKIFYLSLQVFFLQEAAENTLFACMELQVTADFVTNSSADITPTSKASPAFARALQRSLQWKTLWVFLEERWVCVLTPASFLPNRGKAGGSGVGNGFTESMNIDVSSFRRK